MDQGAIIGLAALLVAGYHAYHIRKQTQIMEAQAASGGQQAALRRSPSFWRTPGLYALFLLTILAWMPWIVDSYFSHQRVQLVSYGVQPPITFHGTIPTAPLVKQKDDFRTMLIVRLPYGNVDRLRDHAIEKSITYTIDGSNLVMMIPGQINPLRLRIEFGQTNSTIEYDAVMIPRQNTPDDITSLSDVERIGGKILDVRLQIIPTSTLGVRPANQPPPNPDCPTPLPESKP